MAASILTQGLTNLRDAVRGVAFNFWSHTAVATDATAFAANQTAVDPANAGAANLLIKVATFTVVDATTIDGLISINGDTEMTGKNIFTISACKGNTRTDAITRSVRTNSIGVQAGDAITVGPRMTIIDAS